MIWIFVIGMGVIGYCLERIEGKLTDIEDKLDQLLPDPLGFDPILDE